MKTKFHARFARDLNKIQDRQLLERVEQLILLFEHADSTGTIPGIKKLQSDGDYFRIRLGDYRVGIEIAGDTVVFVRFLHRKEIYRYFP